MLNIKESGRERERELEMSFLPLSTPSLQDFFFFFFFKFLNEEEAKLKSFFFRKLFK